jgi:hypothetical protein
VQDPSFLEHSSSVRAGNARSTIIRSYNIPFYIPLLLLHLEPLTNTPLQQSNDNASPIGKKPYQGDLLIFLIYEGVFTGAKSIGVKFAERFVELANNKGNRPEMPIPLLALVATEVWSFLLNFLLYSLVFKVYAALSGRRLVHQGNSTLQGINSARHMCFMSSSSRI